MAVSGAATTEDTAPDARGLRGGDSGAARRARYGRRRGPVPPGEWFVGRLGAAAGEPFAQLDDPEAPPPARPAPATPLDDLRFVAVDCETTGQTPHRLIEIGAVAFTVGGHVASFETLVHCTDRINPYARRLHGIAPEMLAGTPPPGLVMDRFRRFAAGSVLVEHSADAFDTRLLARTLGEPLDCDNVDTSRIASTLWSLRDTIGLERLCAELGIEHRGPHTALGDAEATAACFLELLSRARETLRWATLADLLASAQPPPPRLAPPPRQRRPVAGGATATADCGGASDAEPEPAAEEGARRRRRRGGRRRRRPEEDAAAATAPAEAVP